jgi:DNA polymerase-3 subunit delta'
MRFAEIIGQDEVKTRLRMAFEEGRIAHALMFLGPEGSGNLALALAFAQYVSCEHRTETDSCGQCSNCRGFANHQYPDLYYTFPFFNVGDKATTCQDWMKDWREFLQRSHYGGLDEWRDSITKDNKQLHISVYEAANIIHQLSLKSFSGRHKFQLIWMAEFLKPDTANKLLKIVEEPPEKTIFLFVASSTENLLQTILSRVQVIHIPRIQDQEIRARLVQLGATEARSAEIAHFAHGDWNKATRLLAAENPDENFSIQFQTWMRNCYKKDVIALVKWADMMHAHSREDQKHFIQYAMDQIRQNLILNYTGDAIVRMNQGEKAFADKFAPYINDLNAEDLMDELNAAYRDISQNVYSKLVFTDLSMKVHYMLVRK